MSSEAVQALVAELTTAKGVITPQVRGMADLLKEGVSIKSSTREAVQARYERLTQRRSRITEALNALKALSDDGYPEAPKAEVNEEVFADLQEQLTDFQVAIAEFAKEDTSAVEVEVQLGTPEEKPI